MEEKKVSEKEAEEEKEEGQNREMSARPKNIIKGDEGVVIMANLYIIRYLYFHMKKHDKFTEEGSGNKKRSSEFYGKIIPISRARFIRIMKGYNFRFAMTDISYICSTFGIDIKYFQREKTKLLQLVRAKDGDKAQDGDNVKTGDKPKEGDKAKAGNKPKDEDKAITINDWKAFFWINYKADFESIREGLKNFFNEKEKEKENRKKKKIQVSDKEDEEKTWQEEWDKRYEEGARRVEKALKATAQYDWDKNGKESDAVYRIYYYYRHGYRIDEDMSTLLRLKSALDKLDYSEWKKLDIRQAREYYKVLNNHVRYLEAALTMYDLWHEKEKTEEMKRAKEAPPKKIEGNS